MVFLKIFVTAKQRGASLLEFTVAVAVVAILLTVLLQRLWYYQGEAEQAAVQTVVGTLRTALDFEVAQGKLPGRTLNLTILTEQNPFSLLKNKPSNYVGELFRPNDGDIGEGNWCFDRSDKSLVYLLNKRNSFLDAETKRLIFKVKLLYLPQRTVGVSAPAEAGVTFEQVRE
jgi:type II secretory pathway pseudopilin PulG